MAGEPKQLLFSSRGDRPHKHSLRLLWQRECAAPRWCGYLCACNGRVAGFLLFHFQSFPFPTPKTALKKKVGGGEAIATFLKKEKSMLQSLRFEPTVDGFSPLHASAPAQQGEAPILGFLTSAPLALKRDKDALSSAFLSKLAPASNIPHVPCLPSSAHQMQVSLGPRHRVTGRQSQGDHPPLPSPPWMQSHGSHMGPQTLLAGGL